MVLPKALVPVGDTPILEILVRQLRRQGFDDLVLTVGHLAELLEAYFHGGRAADLGVRVSFVRERSPLGTAGCLALVPGLSDSFLVLNADVLTTLDFRHFLEHHRAGGAVMTIAACERRERLDWGVLEISADGRLEAYVEKPERSFWISMGIYACEPALLAYLRPDEPLDIPELATRLLADGRVVGVYRSQDYWLDLGHPRDYARAAEDFESRRREFLPEGPR
jgi:NDP-sugar pyrophosphorylase family protein